MNHKYEGTLGKLISKEISLNVNHLEKGNYKLKIVLHNKVINTTHFKKQ